MTIIILQTVHVLSSAQLQVVHSAKLLLVSIKSTIKYLFHSMQPDNFNVSLNIKESMLNQLNHPQALPRTRA